MHYWLRYGLHGLTLDLPESWNITVVSRRSMPGVLDPPGCIEKALTSPAEAKDLAQEAKGSKSACIMICDVTRPVPNRLLLRPLLDRLLGAGLQPARIIVLVATGLHRPNDGEELASLIGDPWIASH